MKFKLIDNAIDSLNFFIEFYRKDTKSLKEHHRYMKLAILMLQNAVELLIKSILVKENELLIYKDLTDDNIINALKEKKKHQKIEDFLIGKENVKTISYQTAVEYYCKLFDADEKHKKVLLNLGYIRNTITHLGINNTIKQQYNTYNTIYETINIISNIMYTKLLPLHKSFKYNDIIDQLDDFLEIAWWNQEEMFVEKNELFVYQFGQMLDEILKAEAFQKFLLKEKITIKHEIYDLDEFGIMLDFTDLAGTKIVEQLYSQISFYNNIMLLCTDYGSINLLISIDENKLFLYEEEVIFNVAEEKEKFWKADAESKKCKSMSLNKRNLEKSIEQLIRSNLSEMKNS